MEGVGSTFTVEIPLEEVSEKTGDTKAFSGKRCLLLDDDKLQLTLFENQLKQLGIESVACMKAEEILGYLEHEHFDALFTDMQMPEIALARKLPVVMVTARSDADQFLSEGFSGILHKPFSLAQLSFCLSGIWNEEATPREIEDEGERGEAPYDFAALTAFAEDDAKARRKILETFFQEIVERGRGSSRWDCGITYCS